MPQQINTPPIIALLLTLAALLVASGCASVGTPVDTGIRDGFESIRVGRVAVLPFSASDTFGLDPETLDDAIAVYQTTTVARLKDLGSQVLGPDAVLAALQEQDRIEELFTRLDLKRPLDELFEPPSSRFASIPEDNLLREDRDAFLKELGALLDVNAVLLGEVVYHTNARCEASRSSKYTQHVVMVTDENPSGASVPCAVSHFQAKLVDVRRGETIWFNRALRELRATNPGAAEPDPLANARANVGLVLVETQSGLRSVFAAR